MITKLFYVFAVFFIAFYFCLIILMGAESFFTVISEETYMEKPMHFFPKSSLQYEARLLGIFPIVVEAKEEFDCNVMIIDGPLTKVTSTSYRNLDGDAYSGYHLFAEKYSCFYLPL
jgi:hypothetical protein